MENNFEQNASLSKKDFRQVRKQEQQKMLERSLRWKKIRKITAWVLGVVIFLGGVYYLQRWSDKQQENLPGEKFAIVGREHITPSDSRADYNSNPPTSGPHYSQPAGWGIYQSVLPDEQLIHNLEHGGIWISYQNPDDKELVAKLESLAQEYKTKVILTPRPQNDTSIALAAWGRLQKLTQFDAETIRNFIKSFVNKGPELVP